jgi:hypothetical protein
LIVHLDALKERALGNENVGVPPAPFAYVIMQYRRRMHMTPQQVSEMPGRQLLLDLEMIGLESRYGPASIKPSEMKPPR